jgi:hypothetical protein
MCTKRINFMLALAFLLFTVFANGAFAQPPVNMRVSKFDEPASRGADRAFRMKEGFRGQQDAARQADKLFKHGGKGQTIQFKDDGAGNLIHINQSDPSAHFRVNKKTGDFSFNRGIADLLNDKQTQGLPTGQQAIERAKSHLKALGELPDEEELVVQHVGGLRMAEMTDGNVHRAVDKLTTVHFGRRIKGLDVAGPGSKIVVDLGTNGELVGLQKRWMSLTDAEEKIPPGSLRSRGDVEQSTRAKLQREWAKAKKINADSLDLGYYDDGEGNIEPAYFTIAELVHDSFDEGGKVSEVKSHFLNATPAMKNSRAKFDQEDKPGRPPQRESSPPQKKK